MKFFNLLNKLVIKYVNFVFYGITFSLILFALPMLITQLGLRAPRNAVIFQLIALDLTYVWRLFPLLLAIEGLLFMLAMFVIGIQDEPQIKDVFELFHQLAPLGFFTYALFVFPWSLIVIISTLSFIAPSLNKYFKQYLPDLKKFDQRN
jgi:hypothetical protein